MNKKVLAIYYTQSGQMRDIIDSFTAPLIEAGNSVEKVQVKLVSDYPFPWTGQRFYSVMPDCVQEIAAEVEPFDLKEKLYDLVILGYQPWFLWPSIPSNSILNNPNIKSIIKGTPVVTVSEARNMWLNAYERIRQKLKDAGANLVGNIALVDKHPNAISFFTIFHWMLGGKKDKYLGIFPKPGVSADDIAHTKVYGQTVCKHLAMKDWEGLQDELLKQNAVKVKYPLMLLETTAVPTYLKWVGFIERRRNRGFWLMVFKYYLYVALFVGAPILLTLDAIFIKPFSQKRIKAKTKNYLQVS
ncbi:hypothetical protein [Mucilaginibacter sp.]|jgi:hypothetical protein|uniref:hypothetical protein n=1 Tax=Mucilaginibacter sp. TaxID=1882438 RepID=UPI002C6FDCF5|nr:hypothetical protein [Mucilaginibacter sp.]HTI58841.1 hypothetical protein [Mucilaginibacter sp.]